MSPGGASTPADASMAQPPSPQPLEAYGLDDRVQAAADALGLGGVPVGRVISQHRGEYRVVSEHGELRVELSGRQRHELERGELPAPAVGDWLALERIADGRAWIRAMLPRTTTLTRRAAGRTTEAQVVAVNVDVVLIATSLNYDLNLRRIDRYLTLVTEAGARPVIVLTKADLVADVQPYLEAARERFPGVELVCVSAVDGRGLEQLERVFEGHATVALLGSSGVGKSTLLNRWLGQDQQSTRELRANEKGRHTTTHRELFLRPGGGVVIDTPGMRELGLWEGEEGIRETFADLEALAEGCKFRDCSHQSEPGCALLAAVETGTVDLDRYFSYLKLQAELEARKRQRARREQKLRKRRKSNRS